MRWIGLIFLFLVSCHSKESDLTVFEKTFFDIHFRMLVGSSLTLEQKNDVEKILQETFEEVDLVYNNWNPNSELSQFNVLESGQKMNLSPRLSHLLSQAERIYTLSEGRFDPTIEPLQQIWKRSLRLNTLPSQAEIDSLLPAIGWTQISHEGTYYWKNHSLTALDVGGISKGYAVDLIIDKLLALGHTHLFVEWGGEVRACGGHPSGRPWQVGIAGMGTIEIIDGALATSGDYYQNWEVEGDTYFHIIDPFTKTPLKRTDTSIATTSVLAPTCILADGLATTLMLFSSGEEAAAWASSLEPTIQCWIGTHKN